MSVLFLKHACILIHLIELLFYCLVPGRIMMPEAVGGIEHIGYRLQRLCFSKPGLPLQRGLLACLYHVKLMLHVAHARIKENIHPFRVSFIRS